MYSTRARELAFSHDLQAIIQREYQLDIRLRPSPLRGFYGEIWELHSRERKYIAKLDCSPRHQPLFLRNLPVLPFLWEQGMRRIPQIVPTRKGALHLPIADGILAVFTYVSGPMVGEAQFSLLYDTLTELYAMPRPPTLAQEDFLPHGEEDLTTHVSALRVMPHRAAAAICDILDSQGEAISKSAGRLRHFAALCQGDFSGFVLTHGDPRNNGVLHNGQAYLIDWDDPLWAPPERDAWQFIDQPGALERIEGTLEEAGFDYPLRRERMAYYGYSLYFQCLREILSCFFDMLGKIEPEVFVQVLQAFFVSPTAKRIRLMERWT